MEYTHWESSHRMLATKSVSSYSLGSGRRSRNGEYNSFLARHKNASAFVVCVTRVLTYFPPPVLPLFPTPCCTACSARACASSHRRCLASRIWRIWRRTMPRGPRASCWIRGRVSGVSVSLPLLCHAQHPSSSNIIRLLTHHPCRRLPENARLEIDLEPRTTFGGAQQRDD